MGKSPTSVRLSDEGERLRAALSQRLGINKTAVIELALREFANRYTLTVPQRRKS